MKLSTLTDKRELLLHEQGESEFPEPFVRRASTENYPSYEKNTPCADFQTLIFIST